MPPPIFIDANIPIYPAGRPHALKEPCTQILRLIAERLSALITDAEVLQELLHRYLALGSWSHGKQVFSFFSDLLGERVEPVYRADVELASSLIEQHPRLSAPDLVHAAVVQRVGATRIITADRAFETLPDTERLDPAALPVWLHHVLEAYDVRHGLH